MSQDAHLIGKKLVFKDQQAPPELDHTEYVHEHQLPANARIIPHGGMVTMDYKPDRFNVQLDPDNKIVRVYYG